MDSAFFVSIMPYEIRKENSQFCVFKTSGGDTLGCHDTQGEAESQIAAIHANEGAHIELTEDDLRVVERIGRDPRAFRDCMADSEMRSRYGSEEQRARVCAAIHQKITGIFPSEHVRESTFKNLRDTLAVSVAPVGEVTGRKWDVVIIGPDKPSDLVTVDGQKWIRTDNHRLYSIEGLRRAFEAGLFEGAKVYDNHLTDNEFQERGTMRSNDEWLASLVDTRWDSRTNEGVAVMQVVDDTFADKLKRAFEQKVLHTVGLSQDVMRDGFEKVIDGQRAEFVTEITTVNSVDAVMDPAGGGAYRRALEAIRSTEAMSPEQIAKFREAINASALSEEAKAKMLAILDAEGGEQASEQDETLSEATAEEVVEEIEQTIEVVADAALPPEVAQAVIEPLQEAEEVVIEAAASEEPERVTEARRGFASMKRVAEAVVKTHVKARRDAKKAKAIAKPAGETPPQQRSTEAETSAVVEAEKTRAEASKLVEEAKAISQKAIDDANLRERQTFLTDKLKGSGLPESFQKLVASQFEGKTFPNKDLMRAIEANRSALGMQDDNGNVTAHGARSSISINGVSLEDELTVDLLRHMMGATRFHKFSLDAKNKEGVRIFESHKRLGYTRAIENWVQQKRPSFNKTLKLSNWYYRLTGGGEERDGDFGGMGIMSSRATEANLTTSSLSTIVKNTVNILLAAEYGLRQQWWDPIVEQEDVDTIDQTTLARLFGVSQLDIVTEGSAYTELTWKDEEETADFFKRGNYLEITIETFLKDKLNRLGQLPILLADSWFNTVGAAVANVFTNNSDVGPTLSDSGSLFNNTVTTTATGHANLLTAAFSSSAYQAVVTAMKRQTNQPLGVGEVLGNINRPEFVLHPIDLEVEVLELLNSELTPGTANNDKNIFQGAYTPVEVPNWTDTNDWASLAKPMGRSPIYLIWLRGRRTPELFTADDETQGSMFSNDTIRYKVRKFMAEMEVGTEKSAAVADWRSLHKNNVA